MLWDVFCKVIDNYGDLGVCWRLCCNLAERGEQARLWVDDATALTWMAPTVVPGIQVMPWSESAPAQPWPQPGEVVIEAFGCELPPAFVTLMATQRPAATWINLEYLTAEPYAERCHALPSPVMHGPGAGLIKHFFYPGFTVKTGGLLRESTLQARQADFDRTNWLRDLGVDVNVDEDATNHQGDEHRKRWVSLFCYEPSALPALLSQLIEGPAHTHLLVTSGRAQAAVKTLVNAISPPDIDHPASPTQEKLTLTYLPHLSQTDFDHLLWSCDVNFVRGEDSLVRAIWAGKPFVWQIYPQDDDAHQAKLNALLDALNASPTMRAWHQVWNGQATPTPLPAFGPLCQEPATTTAVIQARHRLMQQTDLVTQLQTFVTEKKRLKS